LRSPRRRRSKSLHSCRFARPRSASRRREERPREWQSKSEYESC
jgi:hypothetical protein